MANANGDAGKQITDFHNLIAQGAQGIIVVPTDSDAIVPALSYAAQQSVPVVAIDIGPSGGKTAMIVRADNIRMGEDACQEMGKALGGQGKVLSMMGDQATTNGRDRTTGFNAVHGRELSRHRGDRAADLLEDRPRHLGRPDRGHLDARPRRHLHAERRGHARGRAQRAQERRQADQGRRARATSTWSASTARPTRSSRSGQGWLDAAISQPLNLYVKYGLQYLQEAVAGETFAVGPTDHDSRIEDFNGNLMDLLPAPIVTAANVDDPDALGQPGQIAPVTAGRAGEPLDGEPAHRRCGLGCIAGRRGDRRLEALWREPGAERRLGGRSRPAIRARWSAATAPASRRWSAC